MAIFVFFCVMAVAGVISMPIAHDQLTIGFKRSDGSDLGFVPLDPQYKFNPFRIYGPKPMFGVLWESQSDQNRTLGLILAGHVLRDLRRWVWIYYCGPGVIFGSVVLAVVSGVGHF